MPRIRAAFDWLHDYSLSGVWRVLDRLDLGWRWARPAHFSPDPAYADKHAHLLDCLQAAARQPEAVVLVFLVLTLLAIVTSLSAPSLSRFFRGRSLEAQARQLLSLTHAGQSRAVADGFPMLLWIDSQERAYGLQEETTSSGTGTGAGNQQNVDPKAEEFTVDEKLRIEAIDASPMSVNGHSLPAIRFLPDGTVDEDSPKSIRLTHESGDTLWLIQATNRLSYEIRITDK